MAHTAATLIDFFGLEKKHLEEKRSGMEATATFTSLKETILKDANDVCWPTAYDTVVDKVGDLLNIRLSEIMIGAWKKYSLLLKYCDPTRYGPDETFLVPLAEHTISSTHKPYIEIHVNEEPVTKIHFPIMLSLVLEGFVLKVQGGKIKEIQTGTCRGKGEIQCEGVTIREKQTDTCTLPGVIHLGDGVPILD